MTFLPSKFLRWGIFLATAVLLATQTGKFLSAGILNFGVVRLLRTKACDMQWFVCQVEPDPYPLQKWDGNSTDLEKVASWLERGRRLDEDNDWIDIRLGETYFSLENRKNSAELMQQVGDPDWRRSRLFQTDTYQSQLILAEQAFAKQQWDKAVYHYRLGLSWGDEKIIESDQVNYLLALAESFIAAEKEQDVTRSRFLAAKFLFEAGESNRTRQVLADLLSKSESDSPYFAYSHELMGRILEDEGVFTAAAGHYLEASDQNPDARLPLIRYLLLLKRVGTSDVRVEIEKQLADLGPSYRLGAHGEGYSQEKPVRLDSGWTLVGYDLDEDMLEQAHFFDVWLWWQHETETPAAEDWISAGEFWIQKQRVTNLIPNAGFEWGVDEKGIPLGYDEKIYQKVDNEVVIIYNKVGNTDTNILRFLNSPDYTNVAITSRKVPVNRHSEYLMSGEILDTFRNANIGRTCIPDHQDVRQYYLVDQFPNRPIRAWIIFSGLEKPYYTEDATLCRSIVLNFNSEQTSDFDNIVFFKLAKP